MISVICCTIRDEFMENVFQNYLQQTYKEKELILILNKDGMDLNKWKERAMPYSDISVHLLPALTTLGECMNYGIKASRYEVISKFDDDDYYAPHYLSDQLRALVKKNADVVCKRTIFMYFVKKKTLYLHFPILETNTFVNRANGVKGATLMFHKRVWDHVKFNAISLGEDYYFVKACIDQSYRIYVTDEFNFVCLRRSGRHHTWKINSHKLISDSKLIGEINEFRPYVEKEKRRAPFVGEKVKRVRTTRQQIALTFDDGPDPVHTPEILDLLKQYRATATFFVLGEQLEKYPNVARRIVAEGHELGNHTYSHPDMIRLQTEEMEEELLRTGFLIEQLSGHKPLLFRPPYLSYNHKVLETAKKLGYLVISCSIASKDYTEQGVNFIVDKVMSKLTKGDIVLLHDSGGDRSQTVAALEMVLRESQDKQLQCVSVSKLLDSLKKVT